MSNIYLNGSTDILTAIRTEKAQVKRQITDSEKHLRKRAKAVTNLASPLSYLSRFISTDSLSNLSGFGGIFSQGLLISQGVKIGMKVAQAVASTFRKHRK